MSGVKVTAFFICLLCGTLWYCSAQSYKDDSLAVRAILDTNGLDDVAVEAVTIAENNRITELMLYFDSVWVVPSTIGKLSQLRSLYLFYNLISQLPAEIGALTNLEELNASNNFILNLPPQIGQLTNLKILDLSNNSIGALPKEIGNLNKLDSLNLNFNNLSAIPEELCGLANLKNLQMGHNAIAKLPQNFGNLTAIGGLGMEFNKLTSLPESIVKIKPEKFLDLGYNKLLSLNTEITEWADRYDPDWKKTQNSTGILHGPKESFPISSNPQFHNRSITFFISGAANVRLHLYGAGGRHIRTITRGVSYGGYHTIDLKNCLRASGIYYYVLSIPGSSIKGAINFCK